MTVLYDFSLTAADGNEPIGGLVEATDGNFYGTLLSGGAGGSGSIYRLTPAGRKQLVAAESKWERLQQAIARVMTAAVRA